MDIGLYLGRFFGIYLIAMGLALVVRRDLMVQAIHEFVHSKALIMMAGVFTFIIGLLLVLAQHTWSLSWRGLVTLLCYMTVVAGLLRLFFPEYIKKTALMMEHGHAIRIAGCISIIIGIYLVICTFS